MDVSGGNVTIDGDGGSGGVGHFLGLGTGDEGSPQEVARRASWALHFFGGGGFFGCKA